MNKTVYDWVKNCECNVCAVDWGKMAKISNFYAKVATNYTRLASNSIVRFMSFLKEHGMNITDVSIAGHR